MGYNNAQQAKIIGYAIKKEGSALINIHCASWKEVLAIL